MIPIDEFRGHELGVFGLGETGLAAALALKAGGAVPIVWDEREEAREQARAKGLVAVDLLEFDWTRFLALVIGPGVPLTHPVAEKARALNIPVIGDVELFARAMGPKERRKARIIAVTGTNGKSITTSLIGHILQRNGFDARVGGNIVKPLLALDPPGEDTIYVLELSSFQLETSYTLAPDVAVMLNLAPDHLDRHGTMEAYSAVKARIFDGQTPDDLAVLGIDDDHSLAMAMLLEDRAQAGKGAQVVKVSTTAKIEDGLYVDDGYFHDPARGSEALADMMTYSTLPGRHNWQNALAAIAAVRRYIREPEKILAGLQSFPGVAHRMEIVATIDDIWFINDSKASNPNAAARALDCYETVYWVAGGRVKDEDFSVLEPYLGRVRKAYLIGEAAPAMAEALSGKVEAAQLETLDRAVVSAFTDARRDAASGSVVLFSPACSSRDQYADFEARGDAFRTLVRALETASRRGGRSTTEGA